MMTAYSRDPETGFIYTRTEATPSHVEHVLVIGPNDLDLAEQMARAWERTKSADLLDEPMTLNGLHMLAALRSLLDPKPEEPKGLGAVVRATFRDHEGKGFGPATWVHAGDGSWVSLTDGTVGHSVPWPFLSEVEVLSHGVPEDGAR